MLCAHVYVQDIMLRMALKEFLQHFKESRGVLGQAASKRTGKQASQQAGKHLEGIQSEPYPVGL